MSEFENNVIEEVTENVEETTEEITEQVEQNADESEEKLYTQKELDERVRAIVDKRVSRREAKIRREYEKKYSKSEELEAVVKAGTGLDDVTEITEEFRKHYEGKGIQIPKSTPVYSDGDTKTLAAADANAIIEGGLEDVTEELNRLTELGVKNMTAREKQVFTRLAEYHENARKETELSKLGVDKSVYTSDEFQTFAGKFAKETPITDIYNIYNQTKQQKQVKTPGSMKGGQGSDKGVKDFYSVDEAKKFTNEDYDKTPGLYEAVLKSMPKWKR